MCLPHGAVFRLVNSATRLYSACSSDFAKASQMTGVHSHAIASDAASSAEHARRHIAVRLLPFVFLLYITNYLDRTSVAYAAIGCCLPSHANACGVIASEVSCRRFVIVGSFKSRYDTTVSVNHTGLEIRTTFPAHARSDDCLREQLAALPSRTETNQHRCCYLHLRSYFLRRRRALPFHERSKKDNS